MMTPGGQGWKKQDKKRQRKRRKERKRVTDAEWLSTNVWSNPIEDANSQAAATLLFLVSPGVKARQRYSPVWIGGSIEAQPSSRDLHVTIIHFYSLDNQRRLLHFGGFLRWPHHSRTLRVQRWKGSSRCNGTFEAVQRYSMVVLWISFAGHLRVARNG
jgi:hypothetical protein